MFKKSRSIAVLLACIVMFAAVQPACAVIGVDPACETLKFIGRVLVDFLGAKREENKTTIKPVVIPVPPYTTTVPTR